MGLPCAVVRDLLPLYAEKMTEDETKKMIDEHLEGCAECRQKLAGIDTKVAPPVETAKPLVSLKKEIKKRRWFAAAIAALCVFIGVFTYFFYVTGMKYVPWQEGLVEVARVETLDPADGDSGNRPEGEAGDHVPAAPVPPVSGADKHETLILNVSSSINGFEEHVFVDDDGTETVLIQGISTKPGDVHQNQSAYEMSFSPVPARLIYGFQQPQKLLWGTPMNGGTEVLPRLALAYYLIIAAVSAALCGIAWAVFRKRRCSRILRQLFFAPVSYILSHLLLKGTHTTSVFMERDLLSILLLAAAVYALLTLAWQVLLQRRKEA